MRARMRAHTQFAYDVSVVVSSDLRTVQPSLVSFHHVIPPTKRPLVSRGPAHGAVIGP